MDILFRSSEKEEQLIKAIAKKYGASYTTVLRFALRLLVKDEYSTLDLDLLTESTDQLLIDQQHNDTHQETKH